jgi:hypothetical protein
MIGRLDVSPDEVSVYHDRADLGTCPECGTSVPRSRTLIEYETDDGHRAVFVECPGCAGVVHPQ